MTVPQADLINTLTTLNQIGASINQLAGEQDLTATLQLIAEGAVRAVDSSAAGDRAAGAGASVVIWIYDAAQQAFAAGSRVSAGEPSGASIADFPRLEGIGHQAVRTQRRVLSSEPGSPPIHPAKRAAGATSLICYPLTFNHETVGVLYVYRCDDRPFNPVERLILENFVNLAGLAIHYGRRVGGLSRALRRKVRELEKLRRASQLISSRTNLDETLQEILSIGLDMTAAQYGSLEMYDPERELLLIKALAGSHVPPAEAPPLPLDENSVVGRVALQRQSLRITDLRHPEWRAIYQPLPIDKEMRSELAVPLLGAGGALEGVLNIESPQPGTFTEEDQNLLEALATQAVIAIQEMRLLDAMQEIVQVLLTMRGDDLLKLIIDRACNLINVSSGSIWMVEEPDRLVLRQSTEGERLGESVLLSDSFVGQAIRLRQPLAIDDVRRSFDDQSRRLAEQHGWVSAIVVPLLASDTDERPVGAFNLYASHLRDFSDWDKKLLICLANHAAVAIRDAQQMSQLKQAQERQATAETIAAVGDLAANLLHQLNNKFGAVSVRVQAMQDKCAPALANWPYLAANLQKVAHDAQEAMAIVRASMAHLQPIRPHPVDVASCLARALERAQPGPAVTIFQNGLDDLPSAWAGEKQVEMVFYNLIENALSAMDGQGQLRLSGRLEGGQLVVTVADSGPGIPLERQERIFEFPAAGQDQTEQPARLGFGLWWVKTFVDRFGGRVSVESEAGRGAAFTVWLPLKESA